jgi:hypothetical protein
MTVGDFSSIVQLGVGLHAGTAILQSIAEFAEGPLTSRIQRLKRLAELKATRDDRYNSCLLDIGDLIGDVEIKKVQFFNEYRVWVIANVAVAILLSIALGTMAFIASSSCPIWVGLLLVMFSLVPAAFSLALLVVRWDQNTATVLRTLHALEGKLGLGRELSWSDRLRLRIAKIRRVS